MREGRLSLKDCLAVADATEYEDLTEIALKDIESMRAPRGMVHAPLTTGGTNLDENWQRMRTQIWSLRESKPVFNQLVFIKQARRVAAGKAKLAARNRPFADRILSFLLPWRKRREVAMARDQFRRDFREKFHLPILESGLIEVMYFMPGWHESRGARWYYDQALRLGIQVVELPEDGSSGGDEGSL